MQLLSFCQYSACYTFADLTTLVSYNESILNPIQSSGLALKALHDDVPLQIPFWELIGFIVLCLNVEWYKLCKNKHDSNLSMLM